jgi:hypothetical protein
LLIKLQIVSQICQSKEKISYLGLQGELAEFAGDINVYVPKSLVEGLKLENKICKICNQGWVSSGRRRKKLEETWKKLSEMEESGKNFLY